MNAGDIFGDWTVLEEGRYQNRPAALAICKCGIKKWIIKTNLTRGNTTKCRDCSYKDRGPNFSKRITGDHLAAQDKFYDYKAKAKSRGIEFDLDFKTFKSVAKKNCFYCGQEPSNINKIAEKDWADDFIYSGIDRLDNNLGYTHDNVVACCKYCNYMKRELPYKEFLKRAYRIAQKWGEDPTIMIVNPATATAEMMQETFAAVDNMGRTGSKSSIKYTYQQES